MPMMSASANMATDPATSTNTNRKPAKTKVDNVRNKTCELVNGQMKCFDKRLRDQYEIIEDSQFPSKDPQNAPN